MQVCSGSGRLRGVIAETGRLPIEVWNGEEPFAHRDV